MDGMEADSLGVVQEGRVAYVAVESRRGPHVTPFLYSFSSGHLWFLGAADTLTVRMTDRCVRAGVLVRAGAGAVVLDGSRRRMDPLRPADLVAAGGRLRLAPGALTLYALRNAPDLLAFGRDALHGRAGRLPPKRRALLAFDPERRLRLEGETAPARDRR